MGVARNFTCHRQNLEATQVDHVSSQREVSSGTKKTSMIPIVNAEEEARRGGSFACPKRKKNQNYSLGGGSPPELGIPCLSKRWRAGLGSGKGFVKTPSSYDGPGGKVNHR